MRKINHNFPIFTVLPECFPANRNSRSKEKTFLQILFVRVFWMLMFGLFMGPATLNGAPLVGGTTNYMDNLELSFGVSTRRYPKIGVGLCGVPYNDVGKCIIQVKNDKLGDVILLFGVGLGAPTNVICANPQQFAQETARLCKEEGLYFVSSYPVYMKKEYKIEEIAGKFFLGKSIEEYTTGGNWPGYFERTPRPKADYWYARLTRPFIKKEMINMKDFKEKFVEIMRPQFVDKKTGGPMGIVVEPGPIGHGECLEAGADIVFSEHLTYNDITSLSSARGAAKAYEKPLWGAFLNIEFGAMGGYGYGPPKDDSYTPAHQRRLMLDYNLSYIYGANLIFTQDSLFRIFIANACDKQVPKYDAESPECKGFREVAKRFYHYVQTHPRSDHGPSVDIGLVFGNLEGTQSLPGKRNIISLGHIWGTFTNDLGENWKPSIEVGWENIYDIISLDGRLLYNGVSAYNRYAGTPYGQLDIVPIRAPINVLQNYKALMFLGWNTMTPEIYAKLRDYVNNGGHLFMSLPQLSGQIERKPELELINNGDFKDLFGITVKGKVERKAGEKAANIVRFDRDSSFEPYKFPVGTTFAYTNNYPDLEWADVKVEGATVLATVDGGKMPALIENKLGKGTAILMTSYSFSPVPAEFIKPLVVGTAKAGDIELLGEMAEKKDINYAVYPGKDEKEETKIMLVNIDWTTANNVKDIKMRIKDRVLPVEVKEGVIKTVNVLGDLALTVCDDQNHSLSLEKRDGDKYTGKLIGQGVCVFKGALRGDKVPRKITLDGKDILFKYDPVAHLLIAECNLWGEHLLEITM